MSTMLKSRLMSTARYRPAAQLGLTLIELMVSITVGLILVGALAFYFAGQKKTYSYQDALIGLQDSARTAFIHIGRDLRLAGYYGCVPQGGEPTAVVDADANVAPPAGTYSRFIRDIVTLQGTTPTLSEGFELAVMGQNNADADALGDANNQSDRLVINIADPLGLTVAQMDNSTSPIVANNRDDGTLASAVLGAGGAEIERGDVVAVADCQQAAAFVVSNDLSSIDGRTLEHKAILNPVDNIDLQHIYGSDKAGPAELLELRRVRYYIREVGTGADRRFSLYRCSGFPMTGTDTANYCAGRPGDIEELVSNVDAMQLQFGIADTCDSDGVATYRYTDALAFDPERNADAVQRNNALLQTARAVAVRITLTLSAPGITNDEFFVNADGSRSGPYRREFSTVVELRNGCRV